MIAVLPCGCGRMPFGVMLEKRERGPGREGKEIIDKTRQDKIRVEWEGIEDVSEFVM